MLVIKLDSFLEKNEIIFEEIFSLPLSSSSCNLFDETKAISMPEKKAENKIVINATIKSIINY